MLKEKIYILIGLGNPGEKYHYTRHNIGFRVIDGLINQWGLVKENEKFEGVLFKGYKNKVKILALKPMTYMNLSGRAVKALLHFYKMSIQDCLVVYDDADLTFGKLRFRQKGSASTHNGMKSLVNTLGVNEIPRLKVGVGPKPNQMDLASYVLNKFSKSEEESLPEIVNQAIKKVEQALDLPNEGDLDKNSKKKMK